MINHISQVWVRLQVYLIWGKISLHLGNCHLPVFKFPFSYKDTSYTGLGLNLINSSLLEYICKIFFPNKIIYRHCGLGFQHVFCGGAWIRHNLTHKNAIVNKQIKTIQLKLRYTQILVPFCSHFCYSILCKVWWMFSTDSIILQTSVSTMP